MNSDKIILDLCGGSGSWSAEYEKAGYDVRLITLPDNDVRTYQPPANVYGILAAPPCTEFSIAKRCHKRDEIKGMELVDACIRIVNKCKPKFWALENPSGWLSKYLGEPTYSFQPFWFGDGWTKRTLLWGSFNKPQRIYSQYEECPKIDGYIRPNRNTVSIAFNHYGALDKFPQLLPYRDYIMAQPKEQRDAAFRAITSPAFAKAFFEANK